MAKLADNDQISPESVLAALLAHESESAQYVSGLAQIITGHKVGRMKTSIEGGGRAV